MRRRQYDYLRIGEEGCYLECVVFCAEDFTKKRLDLWQVYLDGNANGTVQKNCFLAFPELVMGNLTGVRWTVTKESLDYETKPDEYEITRYEWNVSPTQTKTHFVVTDGAGMILDDPFGESETVAHGHPVSKRIFRRS